MSGSELILHGRSWVTPCLRFPPASDPFLSVRKRLFKNIVKLIKNCITEKQTKNGVDYREGDLSGRSSPFILYSCFRCSNFLQLLKAASGMAVRRVNLLQDYFNNVASSHTHPQASWNNSSCVCFNFLFRCDGLYPSDVNDEYTQ